METLKRTQKREAVGERAAKLQKGTPTVLEMPVPRDDHHEQWSGVSWSLKDKLCVLQGAELER